MQSEQVEPINASDAEAYAAGMRAAAGVDTTAGAAAVLLVVGQAVLAYVESRDLTGGTGAGETRGENEQPRLGPIIGSFCSGFFALLDHCDGSLPQTRRGDSSSLPSIASNGHHAGDRAR